MQRKELLTTLFLLAVALAQSSASSQEPAATSLHLPSTISDEARAYLSSLKSWEERLSEAKPLKTQSDWDDAWSKSEERFVDVNRKVRDRFIQSFEQKKIANIDVFVFTPKNYNPANDGKALLYVHGGAYVFGSPKGSVFLHGPIAFYTGVKVYALKYRLAPRDPYPAGLDDCVAVYRAMIAEFGSANLGVFGHSAGGSLLLSMLLKARDEHEAPMPAAVASITPWSDLAKVGGSYYTLEGISPVLHYDMLDAAANNCWGLAIDDIRDAFDKVPLARAVEAHRMLLQHYEDGLLNPDETERLLRLVATVLQAANTQRQTGIDQGSPYSPTALNVLLQFDFDIPVTGRILESQSTAVVINRRSAVQRFAVAAWDEGVSSFMSNRVTLVAFQPRSPTTHTTFLVLWNTAR